MFALIRSELADQAANGPTAEVRDLAAEALRLFQIGNHDESLRLAEEADRLQELALTSHHARS